MQFLITLQTLRLHFTQIDRSLFDVHNIQLYLLPPYNL